MISTRLVELVIDTVVCLTLAKWETVSGQFGGYLKYLPVTLITVERKCDRVITVIVVSDEPTPPQH